MSTLSSANVTEVNLVLKERTHMRLYLNMLIFTHNLGNWLMAQSWCRSPGSGPTGNITDKPTITLCHHCATNQPCILISCKLVDKSQRRHTLQRLHIRERMLQSQYESLYNILIINDKLFMLCIGYSFFLVNCLPWERERRLYLTLVFSGGNGSG